MSLPAIAIAAVALAAAVFFHEQTVQRPVGCLNPACRTHPSWADPLAVFALVAGGGIAYQLERRKRLVREP